MHVRINFQTGITEAKLLNDDDKSDKNKALSTTVAKAETTGHSHAELKAALKNIKDDSGSSKNRKKTEFRSYEELKAELDDMELASVTDFELMGELFKEHKRIVKENDDPHTLLLILKNFEDLVHQYDNANQFVSRNGFGDVILVHLNSTNLDIKLEALKLLGSSVQNNAEVQIHALEKGCVGVLLRMLVLSSKTNVKSRAIFALSGILRRFPMAQAKFLQDAGLSTLIDLLDTTSNLKLHLKIVTLINDLLLEHQNALNQTEVKSKIKQYEGFNLMEKLSSFHWCKSLKKVLVNVVASDADDHDGIEKCLTAVYAARETCDLESAGVLGNVALVLRKHYAKLVEAETDSEDGQWDFFTEVAGLCSNIVDYFKFKYKFEL